MRGSSVGEVTWPIKKVLFISKTFREERILHSISDKICKKHIGKCYSTVLYKEDSRYLDELHDRRINECKNTYFYLPLKPIFYVNQTRFWTAFGVSNIYMTPFFGRILRSWRNLVLKVCNMTNYLFSLMCTACTRIFVLMPTKEHNYERVHKLCLQMNSELVSLAMWPPRMTCLPVNVMNQTYLKYWSISTARQLLMSVLKLSTGRLSVYRILCTAVSGTGKSRNKLPVALTEMDSHTRSSRNAAGLRNVQHRF